jgi:hypothetical protein
MSDLKIASDLRLHIEYVSPASLVANELNPKMHPDRQIKALARNFGEVGFLVPVIIDGKNVIFAGHARVLAAIKAGALDGGDKATAKAISAAYKSAMVQTFCIPVCAGEDADRTSHRLGPRTHSPEPLQGWTQWCLDIEDIVSLCESEQAISTVQERNRDLLKALAREQPQLYAELGQAFVSRREVLHARALAAPSARRSRARSASAARGNSQSLEREHA